MNYFFVHTPKTSGTTFTKVLQADKTKKTAFFYPEQKNFNEFEKRIKEGPKFHLDNNPNWKENDFIVGHFTYGIHEVFGAKDFKYLGVYRNPTQHYLSMFKHFSRMNDAFQKDIMPNEISLNEMMALEYTHNMQSFFLSGLSIQEIKMDKERAFDKCIENIEKDFIGLYPTEKFVEGMFYFKEKIGLKPKWIKRENVSTNKIEIKDEVLEKLLKLNDLDLRLYDYLDRKFNEEFKGMNLNLQIGLFKLQALFKG